MDSKDDKLIRRTHGGFIEKKSYCPKMFWLQKDKLTKNRAKSSDDLMDRVRAFLPQISAANQQLEKDASEDPNAFNIENTDDNGRVIEMNLALVEMQDDDNSDLEDSSETDDSDSDETDTPQVTAESFRTSVKSETIRKRSTPLVEVLPSTEVDETETDDSH